MEPALPATGSSLLDLDSPVLSLIAEKGVHKELRSTCKALQQICDSCRTRLLIRDLQPTAEVSLTSLSRWPRLSYFCLSISTLIDSYCPKFDLNELLTVISGRQLRCLELNLDESTVDDGLLALVLRGSRLTLRTLKLSKLEIRGGLQESSSELWKCKLKSLSMDGVYYRSSRQGLWSTKLVSGTLGSHLQKLDINPDWESNSTVEGWQEAGKRLKNLKSLSLRECDRSFLKDCLGGFLAGCTQLRKLAVEWEEIDDPESDDGFVPADIEDRGPNLGRDPESNGWFDLEYDSVFSTAAAHCPHLASLALERPVWPAALVALTAAQCQALRHLKVCVNVKGVSGDEVREGLSSLTRVEHLELAFCNRRVVEAQSRELRGAVKSGLLAMRKLNDLNLFRRRSPPSLPLVMHVCSFIWALPLFKVMHCDVDREDVLTLSRLVDIVSAPAKLSVTYDAGRAICQLSRTR